MLLVQRINPGQPTAIHLVTRWHVVTDGPTAAPAVTQPGGVMNPTPPKLSWGYPPISGLSPPADTALLLTMGLQCHGDPPRNTGCR